MASRTHSLITRIALPALVLAAIAAGCGGKAELAVGDTDAGVGTGGSSGQAGSGGDGGSAETDGAASSDAIAVQDGMATDGAGVDAAQCLLFHDPCDMSNDQCCAPMACTDGPNGAVCRAPADAGIDGATCGGNHADCGNGVECCPGLVCLDGPQGSRCAYPQDAGTIPEGGSCLDQFADCSDPTQQCCPGLTCSQGPNGSMRCRPEYPTDGGTLPDASTCLPQWTDCSNTTQECCPGLACLMGGNGSMRCRPADDGGMIMDGGTATDANACLDQWADCSNTAQECCPGLACIPGGSGTLRCRPAYDGGADAAQCVTQWMPCTDPSSVCCAGLTCQSVGPTMLCL